MMRFLKNLCACFLVGNSYVFQYYNIEPSKFNSLLVDLNVRNVSSKKFWDESNRFRRRRSHRLARQGSKSHLLIFASSLVLRSSNWIKKRWWYFFFLIGGTATKDPLKYWDHSYKTFFSYNLRYAEISSNQSGFDRSGVYSGWSKFSVKLQLKLK